MQSINQATKSNSQRDQRSNLRNRNCKTSKTKGKIVDIGISLWTNSSSSVLHLFREYKIREAPTKRNEWMRTPPSLFSLSIDSALLNISHISDLSSLPDHILLDLFSVLLFSFLSLVFLKDFSYIICIGMNLFDSLFVSYHLNSAFCSQVSIVKWVSFFF